MGAHATDRGRPVVEVRSAVKGYGAVRAVDGIDLDVFPGEFLSLLGPSGCGKTTTLRLIAGLERPDAGIVRIEGQEVAGPRRFVAPERRRVGVVFQDYALFPHLTVAQNVGYGVGDRTTRTVRVGEMLELVGLTDSADRRPHELSGGQQQRVALARALAPAPSIILLDEPFSNLDAKLRNRMRADVRAILNRAAATAVLVTHDQEEALSISDRIAVMHEGHILQVGTPEMVYERPADAFVATFVGETDLIAGVSDGISVRTSLGVLAAVPVPEPGPVDVLVRPELVHVTPVPDGAATVRSVEFFGHDQVVTVSLGDGTVVRARTGTDRAFAPGTAVAVAVDGEVVAFSGRQEPPAAPNEPDDQVKPQFRKLR